MQAWYRIQHGDVETGSTYKLGCEQDIDAIPTATPRFSMTPSRLVHSPTSKYARVVQKSAWRRRNRKCLQVRLQTMLNSVLSMYVSLLISGPIA